MKCAKWPDNQPLDMEELNLFYQPNLKKASKQRTVVALNYSGGGQMGAPPSLVRSKLNLPNKGTDWWRFFLAIYAI